MLMYFVSFYLYLYIFSLTALIIYNWTLAQVSKLLDMYLLLVIV